MALQRFSVNQWLNDNGYDSPTSDANGSKTQINKTLNIDRNGADLDRFSVDGWFADNGFEIPVFDPYPSKPKYQYEPEAQAIIEADEQTNGIIGGIVGSLGAGVVNFLGTAASNIIEKPFKLSMESLKLTKDLITGDKTFEQAMTRAEEVEKEKIQPNYTKSNMVSDSIENAVRKWADIDNEGWLTRAVAGAAESAPALLASYAMPVLGSMLMFNQSFSNTLENDVIIANSKAQQTGTEPDYNTLMTKAVAAGAIEVATEKLFNLFAGMKGSYKALTEGATGILPKAISVIKGFYNGFTKEVTETTLKNFALHIAKKASEEGIEEIASVFLNGFVATLTTDKGKPFFATSKSPDGIVSWEELRGSFVGGAIMGGAMASVSALSQRSKTKKYLESIGSTPITEINEDHADVFNDVLAQDSASESVQAQVKQNLIQSAVTLQEGVTNNTLRTEPIEYDVFETPAIEPTVEQPVGSFNISKLSDGYIEDVPRIDNLIKTNQNAKTAYEREQAQILNDAAYDVLSHEQDKDPKILSHFYNRYKDAKNSIYDDGQFQRIINYVDAAVEKGITDDANYTFNPQYTNALEKGGKAFIPKSEGTITYESFADIVANRTSDTTDEERVKAWVDTEEAQKKFANIKTEMDIVNAIDTIKRKLMESKITESSMLKVNLQMLALKEWSVRIFGMETKNKKIHGIISNLIPRLMDGKAMPNKLEIANLLDTEQIVYEVMKMDDVKEKAVYNMEQKRKDGTLDPDIREKLSNARDGNYQLTPEDVYVIGSRIKELIDDVDNDQAQNLGAEYMDLLAREQTKMGQATVIMRALYNTLWPHMATAYEKKLRKATGMEKFNDKRVEDSTKDAETAKKEATKKAVEDVEKDIKEPKTQDAAELLARRIRRSVEKKPSKVATELMREVNELFKRYKQTVPSNKPQPKDAFEFLAEVAINRGTYQQDVEKAIEKLKVKYDSHPLLDEFYDMVTSDVLSDVTMYKAIAQQLKANGISLTEMTKKVNMVKGSGDEFINSLRSNMTLTDAEWAFLKDKLDIAFGRRMNERIFALQEQYRHNASVVPSVKTAQELTIKALQNATFYDALDIDNIRDQWAKRMKLPYINDAMKQDIYDTMRRISKIQSQATVDTDAADREYTALTARLAQHIPSSLKDKISMLRRFGMLGNLRTHIKNGTTNIVTGQIYKMSDSIANHLSKSGFLFVEQQYRTQGETKYKQGTNTAIDTAVADNSSKYHIQKLLTESSRYSVGSIMGVERQIFKSVWFNNLMNTPYKLQQGELKLGKAQNAMMWMTDTFMFQNHYKEQLANKLNAMGFNEHLTIDVKNKMIADATKFSADISIQRTFRELNALSKMIKNISNGGALNRSIAELEKQADNETDPLKKFALLKRAHDQRNIAKIIGGTVDFITPFVTTPAALVKEGIKFSPVGMGVSIAQILDAKYRTDSFKGEHAAKLNANLAQSIAGTGTMFIIGLALKALGMFNTEPPEDKKGQEAWKQEGKAKYSIYIDGIGSLSIDWLQPLVGALIAGGATYDALRGQSNAAQLLSELVTSNIDALVENTIITSITRQFGGYNKTPTDYATGIAQSGMMQMLPTILQQFNKVIDPYVRDAYSGDALSIMANRALITVPFGSSAVTPKYDIWGKPLEQVKYKGAAGVASRFVLNMLSPFTYTQAQTDTTTAEVIKVFEATKTDPAIKSGALPIMVGDKFTMDGKTWELNADQYAEYSQLAGQYQKEAIEKIISTSTYAEKTDTVKAKAFDYAYGKAQEKARKEMAKRYPNYSYKSS